MFEYLMTASLLTATQLVNMATPCNSLHDYEDVEVYTRTGLCHPLCNLTPNEITTLGHIAFTCRAKATHIGTEQESYLYIQQMSKKAMVSTQTYFRILGLCQSRGCHRQW